ncbi:probable inactive ATP-dependent zinc metalloprotease FTSHI 5, chloroplastic [Malus sylvestris]|uniref:probable inactive ATP-dependent zinc metalloprotease FTSHI 5, chloroplastic n=1 Tax=Malus sylvestris TaxID=3752 RepID=UPI0021AC399B|nr:probable inactive ATP-dependent zinc metalloprotease FTSHI 5, chloroplastic [Malus sylvestris]
MDSVLALRPLPSCFAPSRNPRFSNFAANRRIKIQTFASKFPKTPRIPLSIPRNTRLFSLLEASRSVGSGEEERPALSAERIARQVVLALFCFVFGFAQFRAGRGVAVAAPLVSEAVLDKEEVKYEYSEYTKRLLETVGVLLKSVDEVRGGNGDVKLVEAAWKAVRGKKDELQDEILGRLHGELRELRREKEGLVKRSDEVVAEVVKVKRELEKLAGNAGEEKSKEMEERMEERLGSLEEEYNGIWEKVGEIEDRILRRETAALSYGVRELCFIERECEQLVQSFTRQMRRKNVESVPKDSVTKLSKSDIQKDLENAQRNNLEQMILPNVVEVDDPGPLFNSTDFAKRIKQGLKESRELQKKTEAQIRKNMKKFGSEKRFLVKTPEDEVVKGFPEVELKWMFGDKEVVVPKAAGLHLFHGWKKWREDAKADLKRNLLEDVDFGKQYVAQRQELILLDRDRVVSKTWYNEEKNRWEMDPVAVPFSVSKKLVEHARIRHDWGAMYIALKGDDKEYYVDIKEFEMLFEDFGGFDGLYMKMLACGIPTAVHLMWIPLSELDIRQQFLLPIRLSHQLFNALWKTRAVSYTRDWVLQKFKNINDDIMMTIVFPLVEIILPYSVRIQLGMAWPEEIDQAVDSTWYLKWQSEAEMNHKSRRTDDIQWYFWFLVRSAIYGYVLFHLFRFMKRKIPRFLGYGPLRRDPNMRKLQRVKYYLNYRVRTIKGNKKAGVDPITRAFDQMKRVKNPPIPLKDFASIESMKEEINEVVAFLKNPGAFQEMGARAPRGVLIVGERGTGKTSLALAIAAQAKVPVVNIKAQELEAGLWVGQSASNVRELFQTARELAPVIIFVEDFDLFAGVRGKFIHTKNQDHEAFINQLLVELDGFEKQDGVVLMATTGNLKQIDEALQRPGRMDRVFHLQRPTQAEREKILHMAAKETMDSELIDFVDWRKVAEKTGLLRPIELKLVPASLEGSAFRSKFLDTDELLSYCSWFATFSTFIPEWVRKTKIGKKLSKMLVNHLGLALTKEDLQSVVDLMEPYGQITNGIELLNPPLEWTRDTKFPHAVWAAGRGLIALLLPNFDVVDNIWLEPLSWQGIGCTKITKVKNEGSRSANSESRSYLEKKLVFCFGSHVASQMLLPFGEENFLSSSELTQSQEIATRMVIQYGWGPDDSPAIYYRTNASTALSMGNNHEYEMAAKVEKIYDLAYYKAQEMLHKNRRVLEKIVDELLEFEILTGKDLQRIFEENGGVREKEPFFLSGSHDREPLSGSFLEGGSASGTALLSAAE